MDAKKKRNKKKKGNQGKNTADAVSSIAETVIQCHNHESAPNDHHNGTDADDAMSTVGEEAPQYQNHELDRHANHGITNTKDALSSIGDGIPLYQNIEPAMTQENPKVSSAAHVNQSVEMLDSTMELDVHRLYEAKLDKLHETIKQLEVEKSLWLQKVVRLEEKLNNLQNGYNVLIKKEEVLDKKVRCIEVISDALIHQETSLKERFSGLEETNKALLVQVKMLEGTSSNTVEESQRLVKGLDELVSRLDSFEQKVAITEASLAKKDNELIADRSLSSSAAITSVNNPVNDYASNHLEETPMQLPETAIDDVAYQGVIDVNAHEGSTQKFDEPRTSEEIVPVALDDIQIHEDDPQPPVADDEAEEVPFSDAPIVGAPFRLISFVARYVSGADLVTKSSSSLYHQAA